MLSQKRIWQIAAIVVIKISDIKSESPNSQTYIGGQITVIASTFGIIRSEAKKIFDLFVSINKDELDKMSDLSTIGEAAVKLLQRKIFLHGVPINAMNTRELIKRLSFEAEITALEAAMFEKYLLDYFYESISREIESIIVFESGKQIVENIKSYN